MNISNSVSKLFTNSVLVLSAIALPSLVISLPTQAQNAEPTPNTPAAPVSTDWKDFSNIEQGFMQGCMGRQLLPNAQRTVKQNFCKCAFESYKKRYNPQVFMQINSVAVNIGDKGPALVNLMMKPEMDACMAETGFKP
ncbi:MAG: hypothetical protein NW214_14240 [Pseudanabaenaceae cyanobacterium bins.39]|nr:hypothetical protein [Pseudanabaenaceae cyanobacterium bins.39]